MAVRIKNSRPIVFAFIRNSSSRRIHFCDYLLGTGVELHARSSSSADWIEVPEIPIENGIQIGVLLCGANDTLEPGERMKPSMGAFSRNEIKGDHTFEVDLATYKIPTDWRGPIQFKIVQPLFGGDHEGTYEEKIESTSFVLNLPLMR